LASIVTSIWINKVLLVEFRLGFSGTEGAGLYTEGCLSLKALGSPFTDFFKLNSSGYDKISPPYPLGAFGVLLIA
jgi:hypothetical protein